MYASRFYFLGRIVRCESGGPAFQALRKAIGFFICDVAARWRREFRLAKNKISRSARSEAAGSSASPSTSSFPIENCRFSCDVCVIGFRRGAAELRRLCLLKRGKTWSCLKRGITTTTGILTGAELTGFQRLYSEAGFAATHDHSVGFLAGECLGGGTVVNYCTSFRTPDGIRAEWASVGRALVYERGVHAES